MNLETECPKDLRTVGLVLTAASQKLASSDNRVSRLKSQLDSTFGKTDSRTRHGPARGPNPGFNAFPTCLRNLENHSKVTPRQELADDLASVKLHCFACQGGKNTLAI
jgi:hypothetical protein